MTQPIGDVFIGDMPQTIPASEDSQLGRVQDAAHPSIRKAHSNLTAPPVKAHSLERSFTDMSASKRIRLSLDEKLMVGIQIRAATDHEMSASRLPVEPPVREGPALELFGHAFSTAGGKPPVNEDRALLFSTNLGEFCAVIDGHGIIDKGKIAAGKAQLGEEIAELIAQSIKDDLPRFISENHFNTKIAFEKWSEFIQSKLPAVMAGAVLTICFYERITRLLHVATVGDSQAFVLRQKNGLTFPIPLSPDMSWNSPEAIARVKAILSPEEFEKWVSILHAKFKRFPPGSGLNVGGSLGDKLLSIDGKSAITHLPMCALIQLKAGDKVFVCSDGVSDFASMDDLIDKIFAPNWAVPDFNFAQAAAEYALQKKSRDNITALVWTASRMEFKDEAAAIEPKKQD